MKIKTILIVAACCLVKNINAQRNKVWRLNECVNYALENNISVKQSELDKNMATQDVVAAKWNFFPNLNASASQSYNFGSSIDISGGRSSANYRSNNIGINSSITLFNGFATIHTLKQAEIGVQVQDAALAKMKNDISLNVVNAYLQILFTKEQVKVAQSQLEISVEEVKRITELVNAGVLPEGNLLSIKATQATDNQSLIVAQNSFSIASLQLAQLLQLKEMDIEVEEISVEANNQTILSNNVTTIFTKANETFPEIKLAELNIQSAAESIKIAQSNYYPSLTLSYGFNSIYQHRQGYPDFVSFTNQLNDNLGHSVILSLNVPIFNRYQFRTNVNKAKINQEKIQYNLESEQLRLRATIQTAYTDALASSKSYDAALISVESLDKSFNYDLVKFQEGAINSFEFNQTKNNLLSAQSQLIRAKYDFVFKLKVLEFYFGQPIISN